MYKPLNMSKPIFQKFDGKILLVSPDAELLTSLEFTVASEGYQYNKSSDMKDALSKLRALVPHIIILDADIDEKQVLKLMNPVKRYKKYEAVHFIFLKKNLGNNKRTGKNPGELYIQKPVDYIHLKKVLAEHFGF